MSKGNSMRATFSQRGDEIAGTISVEGDGLFMLECLALLVENLAARRRCPRPLFHHHQEGETMSKNDVTGDDLKSKAATPAYREGFDRIFQKPVVVDTVDATVNNGETKQPSTENVQAP